MMATKFFLILPLCLFILYLGFQQWRQQRSFKTASHSDIFTYNLSLIELFWAPGSIIYLCGMQMNNVAIMIVGMSTFTFTFMGEILFHVLTCVERYMAVVHPVIYRTSRNAGGLKIRKIIISCVWMLCFGLLFLYADASGAYIALAVICILAVAIMIISFCSISVLCILMHPGPGEAGGEKLRVTQSKQRAFNTITAILGVLVLWIIGLIVLNALRNSLLLNKNATCVIMASIDWFNLPISLIAPLLYLNKSRKRFCCW